EGEGEKLDKAGVDAAHAGGGLAGSGGDDVLAEDGPAEDERGDEGAGDEEPNAGREDHPLLVVGHGGGEAGEPRFGHANGLFFRDAFGHTPESEEGGEGYDERANPEAGREEPVDESAGRAGEDAEGAGNGGAIAGLEAPGDDDGDEGDEGADGEIDG